MADPALRRTLRTDAAASGSVADMVNCGESHMVLADVYGPTYDRLRFKGIGSSRNQSKRYPGMLRDTLL